MRMKILSATCIVIATFLIGCEDPDVIPPTISITNPADGVTLTRAVTIKVDASDDEAVDMVEFSVDGVQIGAASTAPFDFEWNLSFWADGKTHNLHAKATDPSGNVGTSDTISVTISELALTLILDRPFDNEIIRYTNEVSISWRELTGAVSYDLELSTDVKFVAIPYSESIVDISVTTSALTQRVYYWRVRGVNDIGEETEWSDARNFSVYGPEAPDLISPENGALIIGVSTPALAWNASEFATLYEVNTSLTTTFTSIEFEKTTVETTLVTTALANSNYSWRVRAQNSVGFWSDWSLPGTFIQSDVTIFTKTFGEPLADEGTSVHQTDDGGYIIAGHIFVGGNLDVTLIKTDSEGNEEWSNSFDTGDTDFGLSLEPTSDGDYIIAGYSFISGQNPYDVLLIKTDGGGNELWKKLFDRSVFDAGRSVIQTSDGGYLIAGRTQKKGADGSEIWLLKTDANGIEEWNRTYWSSSFENGNSLIETADGGFIIAGERCCFPNIGLLIKTDLNGDEEWSREFQGILELTSIKPTSDGGYIIGGSNGSQPILLKTDAAGTEEWRSAYSGLGLSRSASAQQTLDGGYILTGNALAETAATALLLLKTDALGIIEWNKIYGAGDGADGRSVQQTSDGGFIITGKVNEDIWLIKTDSEGRTVF